MQLYRRSIMCNVPNYLKNYSELYEKDPHAANLAWWKDAKWGLFMHYGLYSQLERGEWVMLREKIPIAEYEKLFDSFDPKNFDADFITDLACEAEMSYINITACHHEGFCLWKSDVEEYNSYNAVKRDLVRELAEQCDKKGLGFFTYYTNVFNWRHPYSIPLEYMPSGRPDYDFDDPRYLFKGPEDVAKYWEYAHACMKELLDLEYPLAGMWLDIIMGYYSAPEMVPIEETYKLIKDSRPEALISFKQGATGTEDFASPERQFHSLADRLRNNGNERGAGLAEIAWQGNKNKHNEICTTLQHGAWGYSKDVEHFTPDDVWKLLADAIKNNCNLLANTGPLPDGSIHSEDVKSFREVGQRIRENGWPKPEEAAKFDDLKNNKNKDAGPLIG